MERYEEAIYASSEAIKINPDPYNAWGVKGKALSGLERHEGAIRGETPDLLPQIAAFNRSLAIAPQNHWNWYYRGVAKEKLGAYEEAMADYERARQLKPNYQKAQDGVKRLLLRK
ncbi:MAG: tetratricopeptide repeat protein [Prochloron sp. SP5CPC1]|nr:tetratricopeptide repeat protein [Candidatus Paraprochloron terpiosi SP5CPC1]